MAKVETGFFNLHGALLFAGLDFLLHADNKIPARATNGLDTAGVLSSVNT